jgi:hypothetical protein
MASNRGYLRCKNCGKTIYLSKNFGDAYYISLDRLNELNQFFNDHAFCGGGDEIAHGGDYEFVDEYSGEVNLGED